MAIAVATRICDMSCDMSCEIFVATTLYLSWLEFPERADYKTENGMAGILNLESKGKLECILMIETYCSLPDVKQIHLSLK